MRAEYDFSKLHGKRNPYATKLKKPVTMRISSDVIAYFKHLAGEMDVPYQILINMYLRDCVQSHRKVGWVR
ncbi:MAG: BrnA antitoxin family protein [Candidatus Omnitrophica bacterium]|nr:BrnA antitoxin family protein [Candidatus Omnitrophota bacterium]